MKREEDALQEAVIRIFRLMLPGAIIHHSPNEGNRGGKRGIIDGVRRKKMGVIAGWPDTIIIDKGTTYVVETKPPGKYLSAAQKDLKAKFEDQNIQYFIVQTIDDAVEVAKMIKI
tara:strand:- start:6914 stop:7258 length:345 start_codon:yes stop_codon:yes gene_type:complete